MARGLKAIDLTVSLSCVLGDELSRFWRWRIFCRNADSCKAEKEMETESNVDRNSRRLTFSPVCVR
jgi:hypothetical protein